MKKSLRYLNLCLIILMFSLSSCVNGIDDLYDQYNDNFKKNSLLEYLESIEQPEEDKDDSVSPGEEGFDETNMLYDEYFVYNDGTLNLAAPPRNVRRYKWIVSDPTNNNKIVIITKYWDGTAGNESKYWYDGRLFVIYIPESGLESNKTYQITLHLYSNDDNYLNDTPDYTDVCGLIVYDHVTYEPVGGISNSEQRK